MEYGDLGSLREQIKSTTSRRSSSDDHHVDAAICRAIRKYYKREWRFNTLVIDMKLNGQYTEMSPDGNLEILDPDPTPPGEEDIYQYYYPWDMLRHKRMSRKEWTPSRHIVEWSLTDLTSRWSETLTGIPRGIAYDGTIMVVRPIVEPAYPVEFNYMADVTRPIQKWVDGNHLMLDSVTGEKMSDETIGPWFDQAQDLIHWAAVFLLSMGVYGDAEKAQMSKAMEKEAKRDLERGDQMTSEPRTAKPIYV